MYDNRKFRPMLINLKIYFPDLQLLKEAPIYSTSSQDGRHQNTQTSYRLLCCCASNGHDPHSGLHVSHHCKCKTAVATSSWNYIACYFSPIYWKQKHGFICTPGTNYVFSPSRQTLFYTMKLLLAEWRSCIHHWKGLSVHCDVDKSCCLLQYKVIDMQYIM